MEVNNNDIKRGKSNIISIPEKWLVISVSSAVAAICYLNSLNGEFVHDDVFAIKSNPDVKGITDIFRIFSNDFWGKSMAHPTSHKSYRPLCVLTFRLNYWLGGGDPYPFHVVNVLLHALMTGLFTYTCQTILFLPQKCCFMAGVMFAVHPIHTEAVSGIVGRAEILAGVFFLLSLILYVKSLNDLWPWDDNVPVTQHPWMFGWSMMCAGMGMLCKEQGITVLGVSAAYDFLVCCRRGMILNRNLRIMDQKHMPFVKRIAVMSIVGIVLLTFRLQMMNGHLPEFQVIDNPASFSPYLLTRCLSYSYIWMLNGWLLLAPSALSYDWQVGSIPLVETLYDPRNLATAVFFILIGALIYHWYCSLKRQMVFIPDVVLSAMLLIVIPFLPASNILFRVGFVLAERTLYIPSTGVCILVSYGIHQIIERHRSTKTYVTYMFVMLICLYSWKTYNQNLKWRSRESLFRWGISSMPNNAKVHYNYANYHKDMGNSPLAIHHYEISLRLHPDDASTHNNLGTLLTNETESEFHYQRALQLRPTHVGAHVNLGNLIFKRGEKEEGKRLLNRALELEPRYLEAQLVMANMLIEQEDYKSADRLLLKAMRENPQSVDTKRHYAAFLAHKGDIERAVKLYESILQVDASSLPAIVGAASNMRSKGNYKQAEDFLKSLLTSIEHDSILDELAMIYGSTNRIDQSIQLYSDILSQHPNNTKYLIHFAHVLVTKKDFHRGEMILQKAYQVDPNDVTIIFHLSKVLGRQDKHKEALSYLDHAIDVARSTRNIQMLPKLLYQQGSHYRDTGRYKEAIKSLEQSSALDSSIIDVTFNLGALHHISGNLEKAQNYYMEVLSRDPNHRLTRDNFTKLKNLMMQQKHGKT